MPDKCHHPAFTTNPPQHNREELNYQPQLWKGKVTATAVGGNSNLVSVVKSNGDGTIVGTTTYTVMQTAGPAINDIIIVGFIRGGTAQLDSGNVVYFQQIAGGGLALSAGTLTALWTPGTNTCILTPCNSLTDSTGTGAGNVTCYISFPLAKPALCLPAAVNDILAYIPISGGNFKLFDPPQLPRPTAKYQGFFNTGGAPVAVTADWVRGH